MIYLYTGSPGSGKSYHVARDIYIRLTKHKYKRVVANFKIDLNRIKKCKGEFYYLDNSELTVKYLLNFAKKNHVEGIENQTLLVIDEAQIKFNSREWQIKGNERMKWIEFFSQHRKLGYNIILITQFDRMIDRQIRSLVEYEIKHRKINNFKIGKMLPVTVFACVTYWYGVNEKIETEFMFFRKKFAKIYNSYAIVSKEYIKSTENENFTQ